MSIYAKLANIQKDLFVPKGQSNDFGGYKYRSCEDILRVVKPLCEANQCVLFMTNNLVQVGDDNYVTAEVHLVDTETNEEITCTAQAREDKEKKKSDGSQLTGSATSYARKYALAGLFAIDNEKDADATNKNGKDEEKPFVQAEYDEAIELAKAKTRVVKYINDSGKDFKTVFANQKLTDPSQLTLTICAQYINHVLKEGGTI